MVTIDITGYNHPTRESLTMSQGLSQLCRKKRQKDHVNGAFLDKGIFLREETASSWIAEIDSRYAI